MAAGRISTAGDTHSFVLSGYETGMTPKAIFTRLVDGRGVWTYAEEGGVPTLAVGVVNVKSNYLLMSLYRPEGSKENSELRISEVNALGALVRNEAVPLDGKSPYSMGAIHPGLRGDLVVAVPLYPDDKRMETKINQNTGSQKSCTPIDDTLLLSIDLGSLKVTNSIRLKSTKVIRINEFEGKLYMSATKQLGCSRLVSSIFRLNPELQIIAEDGLSLQDSEIHDFIKVGSEWILVGTVHRYMPPLKPQNRNSTFVMKDVWSEEIWDRSEFVLNGVIVHANANGVVNSRIMYNAQGSSIQRIIPVGSAGERLLLAGSTLGDRAWVGITDKCFWSCK